MKRLFLLLLSFGIWVGLCRAEETEEQPYVNKDVHLAQAIDCINDSNWDCVREQLPLVEVIRIKTTISMSCISISVRISYPYATC